LFGKTLQPEFKERELIREREKQEELAPYIAAALARKPNTEQMNKDDIPVVKEAGRRRLESGEQAPNSGVVDKTRGGAIPIPRADPRKSPS
jgi:hypothetical protein